MDTHRISVEHLPMNNTHDTPETELLLPMCVSVLSQTAAMCSSLAQAAPRSRDFFKHYWRYNPDAQTSLEIQFRSKKNKKKTR